MLCTYKTRPPFHFSHWKKKKYGKKISRKAQDRICFLQHVIFSVALLGRGFKGTKPHGALGGDGDVIGCQAAVVEMLAWTGGEVGGWDSCDDWKNSGEGKFFVGVGGAFFETGT